MNYLLERVSYLRGLMDGLGISESTNEGKVLVNVVDILDDIVDEISELNTSSSELDKYVQIIDEDLSTLEDDIYDEDFDDDSQYIEVECPYCHETVYFDDNLFDTDEELLCPNCSETIYDEEGNLNTED